MVFWGAEVKPGEPFIHGGEEDGKYEGSRLHVSRATLGLDGQGKERTAVKCKVGDGPEHLLCSLTPGVSESCSLDLMFDQDVVFSVTGPTSVHLVGYYMPLEDEGDDDDYPYEDSQFDSEDEEDEEDEYDDYDDYNEEDSDLDVRAVTSVRIEELGDDEPPVISGLLSIEDKQQMPVKESKKAAKKRKMLEAAIAAKETTAGSTLKAGEENDDEEDGDLDIPSTTTYTRIEEIGGDGTSSVSELLQVEDKQQMPVKESKKAAKKRRKLETAAASVAMKTAHGGPLKAGNQVHEEESEDEDGLPLPSMKKQALNGVSKKKDKKNEADKSLAQAREVEKPADKTRSNPTEENGIKEKGTNLQKPAAHGAVVGSKVTKTMGKKAGPAVRKYPNGLEIEQIAIGKPDARQTKPGKKVFVHYTGRLKSSGKIFDSNIGKKPFAFRLGVGEVIKGWDHGFTGMRIGDKRRITVPPSMAYGAKGVPGTIPGNSWLVFDIELMDVAK